MLLNKKGTINAYYIIVIVYVLCMIFTNLSFRDDEGFTMALIHHSFINLIKLDSYDVHPPFYYIILKAFLFITTFWTKSIFIKIIFARLFSVLLFLIGFTYLIKMINLMKIHVNVTMELIYLLFMPSILSFSTQIRMYSLGMCLLILASYEMLDFFKNKNDRSLLFLFIWILLASYTHYFAALFSGILICIAFCVFIYKKDFINSVKLILINCLLVILYLPWLFYTIVHLATAHHHPGSIIIQIAKCFVSFSGVFNSSLNSFGLIPKIIIIMIMYISLICCIIWSFKHLNRIFNEILTINLIIFILILLIGSLSDIIFGYEFSVRFTYPSFVIILFIWLVILFNIHSYDSKLFMLLFLPVLIVMSLNLYKSLICIHYNYIYSQKIVREDTSWKDNKHKDILVNMTGNKMPNILNEQDLLSHKGFLNTDKATILLYLHKNIKPIRHRISFPLSNGSKFGYKVWPNIKKTKW